MAKAQDGGEAMSRRRRGSSDAWYRKKAEAEAFMREMQKRISERASMQPIVEIGGVKRLTREQVMAKYPMIVGPVRSGMTARELPHG